jgi:hypothetical protein
VLKGTTGMRTSLCCDSKSAKHPEQWLRLLVFPLFSRLLIEDAIAPAAFEDIA